MIELTEQDIDYISVGASVLGSGGGGDPKVGRLLAKSMIQKYGPVNLISIDELQDDQYVVPVSGMGAPTVSLEKLPSEIELTNPLQELERAFGKKLMLSFQLKSVASTHFIQSVRRPNCTCQFWMPMQLAEPFLKHRWKLSTSMAWSLNK